MKDIQQEIARSVVEPDAPKESLSVGFVREKIAPLALDISSTVPRRINLLIPTIDPRYIFGGYIAKFSFARQLAENGYKVRVIIVDQCDYNPELWRKQLHAYQGIEGFLDTVELAYVYDRSKPLEVNKDDAFIATTWWTAHIAHRLRTSGKRDSCI